MSPQGPSIFNDNEKDVFEQDKFECNLFSDVECGSNDMIANIFSIYV